MNLHKHNENDIKASKKYNLNLSGSMLAQVEENQS